MWWWFHLYLRTRDIARVANEKVACTQSSPRTKKYHAKRETSSVRHVDFPVRTERHDLYEADQTRCHQITQTAPSPPCAEMGLSFSPCGGVATPPQYFSNGRAKVSPNLYARGDHIRPCFTGQWSAKREPCIIGKRTVSPGRFFRMDCRSRPWVYRITERIFPTSRDCRFVELVFPLCVKDVDRSTP